jgi:very-short-patch-repair endonuclease
VRGKWTWEKSGDAKNREVGGMWRRDECGRGRDVEVRASGWCADNRGRVMYQRWQSSVREWRRLKQPARRLRREETRAEAVLWSHLRGRGLGGLKFRRQHTVAQFIVDFYCPSARLAIELDGEIHDRLVDRDAERTSIIESRGITVIRFRNDDVFERIEHVLAAIAAAANQSSRRT